MLASESFDPMEVIRAKPPKTAPEPTGQATGSNNKITLTIVANGEAVAVEANFNAPLQTVIGKALEESVNVGQPPESWELKDEAGNVLDASKKVKDLAAGVKLFLGLKAGAAG